MKIWISGEVDAAVGDFFHAAFNAVEKALLEALEARSYELALESWDCIAVIRDDDVFPEITRYSRKKRDMDFRLRIAHGDFLHASPQQRETMIFQMMRRSLVILADKGLAGRELDRLVADVLEVGVEHGWS